MRKSNDTDELIRSKLENYSVTPPAHIWSQVQRQLENRKRKTRVLWYRVTAAAAVVVLALLAGWYFNGNTVYQPEISENNAPAQQIEESVKPVDNNEPQNRVTEDVEGVSAETVKNDKILLASNSDKGNTAAIISRAVFTNANTAVNRNNTGFSKLKSRNSRFETDPFPQPELKRQSDKYNEAELVDVERFIIDRNLQAMVAEKREQGGWKMGMYLTPGYSSYTATHSNDYEQNMTYSGSGGNANMGGGLSVIYKTSKRLMVESGIYYAQNGQKSTNTINILAKNQDSDYAFGPGEVHYFSNNVQLENGSMAMNSTAGVIAFTSTPKGAELSGRFESLSGKTNLMVPGGEFSQVFEFMEVPLLVRYRVVDARLGVELLTGVTTGFLVGNNAYIDNQYGLQNIGKTEDISTVNMSGTLGVGTSYALGKNLSLALEPRFSYYFSSINNNPDVSFKPYRIGIFTGLTYEF